MRRNLKTILIITGLLLSILQTSYLPVFVGSSLNLNLVGIFCFAFAILKRFDFAYILGIVCGLFLDIISNNLLGLTPFVLCLTITLYQLVSGFYLRNTTSTVLYFVLAFYALKLIYANVFIFDIELLISALVSALLSCILVPFIIRKYGGEQKINLS